MYHSYARMTFGRHKGELVGDVPTSYLQWVMAEVQSLNPGLRYAIEQELSHRGNEQSTAKPPPRASLQPIVQTWFRRLSLQYHPDRGGSDEQMRVVNNARDLLVQLLSEKGGCNAQ